MKHSIRHYAPLAVLLALALFPYGWLGRLSTAARTVIYTLFPNEAAHAVGHALIFMAIGVALLTCFPALLRRPTLYLGLVLLIGLAQEALQLLYKRRAVVLNDITDIGTDLVAAGLVLALWYLGMEHGKRKANGKGRRTGARPVAVDEHS